MRVLQIIDSGAWAIGQIAYAIKDKNPHLNIEVLEIHPKDLRRQPEVYEKIFEEKVNTFKPDVIHFHYWDIAYRLSKLPCCKERGRKVMLTHHNQKNLETYEWDSIDSIVCHTQRAANILKKKHWNVNIIQHGIDIDRFKFNEEYDIENNTIGYVGRIVPWKGLLEIAKIAKELGTKVICMGRIDKPDYWAKCQEYKDVLDIRFDTPDEKQVEVYHEFGVYVGNSCQGIEEGTLGLLEAMSCGIPVVTTASGEAADIIEDGKNGMIAKFEDEGSLKAKIKEMLASKKRNKIREAAWGTVKNMNEEAMARNYEELYYRTAYEKDLVSVIIPTHRRPKEITEILEAYVQQTYQPIELIVIEDDIVKESPTKKAIWEFARTHRSIPIKYLHTDYKGYGLALARNMGIFEASGHYLVFSDDRLKPDRRVVEAFVERIKSIKKPSGVWGDKGAGKRDFIENFWCIRKKHITVAGMFNERINEYGGQSQEIRERLRRLKYELKFEPNAMAKEVRKAKGKASRRYEIFRSKLKLWKLKN